MRSLKLILEIFFWSFAAAMVMFGAGVVLGLIFAPAVGYLAAIAVIGFLPIGMRLARVVRRRRGAMMLQYLEQAVRLNLPLPRMLRAAQQSERGPLALRLAQLRQLIEEGYPIGAALEGGVPEVAQREATLIASAERMGRLPQALRTIIHEQASVNRSEGTADAAFYRAYPLVMIVALGSAISTLSIFVFPKYETIYKDFAIKLPWITTTTFRFADTIGPWLIFLFGAVVLVASGMSLWQTVRPVYFGRTAIGRGRDYLAWAIPILHGLERDRGQADAFELIAQALRTGTPIPRALNECTTLAINAVLRHKFLTWARAVADGATIVDGARAAGMSQLVVGMLASAPHDPTAAADVFTFLARYHRSRFSRAATTIQAIAVPAVVFVFGFVVAFIALGMFLPLISLINSLSAHAGKWVL